MIKYKKGGKDELGNYDKDIVDHVKRNLKNTAMRPVSDKLVDLYRKYAQASERREKTQDPKDYEEYNNLRMSYNNMYDSLMDNKSVPKTKFMPDNLFYKEQAAKLQETRDRLRSQMNNAYYKNDYIDSHYDPQNIAHATNTRNRIEQGDLKNIQLRKRVNTDKLRQREAKSPEGYEEYFNPKKYSTYKDPNIPEKKKYADDDFGRPSPNRRWVPGLYEEQPIRNEIKYNPEKELKVIRLREALGVSPGKKWDKEIDKKYREEMSKNGYNPNDENDSIKFASELLNKETKKSKESKEYTNDDFVPDYNPMQRQGGIIYKKGGVNLSVSKGEKLSVSRGAGLTAKGRAKYNRETGSHLKAPQPGGGSRKKSFCARSSSWIPAGGCGGKNTRGCAARRRWKCEQGGLILLRKGGTTKPLHDSCYEKVKATYKVFPSAYASGAIAKCRKHL
jgi:hypothetical protein